MEKLHNGYDVMKTDIFKILDFSKEIQTDTNSSISDVREQIRQKLQRFTSATLRFTVMPGQAFWSSIIDVPLGVLMV